VYPLGGDKTEEKKKRKSEYDVDYMRKKCKKYTLLINTTKHPDIIEKLDNTANKNAYLINLIKKDIGK